jgi:hypothetical protein
MCNFSKRLVLNKDQPYVEFTIEQQTCHSVCTYHVLNNMHTYNTNAQFIYKFTLLKYIYQNFTILFSSNA